MKEIKAQQRKVYEGRRAALEILINPDIRGNVKKFADETGIDPTYVLRMLYKEGKSGKRNIGEEYVKLITAKFPDWLASHPDAKPDVGYKSQADSNQSNVMSWPFGDKVTPEEYESLSEIQKEIITSRIITFLDENRIKSTTHTTAHRATN